MISEKRLTNSRKINQNLTIISFKQPQDYQILFFLAGSQIKKLNLHLTNKIPRLSKTERLQRKASGSTLVAPTQQQDPSGIKPAHVSSRVTKVLLLTLFWPFIRSVRHQSVPGRPRQLPLPPCVNRRDEQPLVDEIQRLEDERRLRQRLKSVNNLEEIIRG